MRFFIALLICVPWSWLYAADYSEGEDVDNFVQSLVADHGFKEQSVRAVLAEADRREEILALISRPAEKKPWTFYREIFVTPERIADGVEFARSNQATLYRAYEEYGVPPEMVTAIIGVETNYGRNKGSHRVIDALATLGFDYPPRATFFRGQLAEFFVLACEERLVPFEGDDACGRQVEATTLDSSVQITDLVGSYAGAMGYGQFIPSSYRSFAIDFNNDGRRDIWEDVEDAIGSVAAYFHEHDWVRDQPVITLVQVPDGSTELDALANETYKPEKTIAEWGELGVVSTLADPSQLASFYRFDTDQGSDYYLGLQNFYVITRYNISRLYAMAVWQVATGIADQL